MSIARTGPCAGGSLATVRNPAAPSGRRAPAPFRRRGAVAAQARVVAEEGGHVVVAEHHPAAQLLAPVNGRVGAKARVLRVRVGDRVGGEGVEVHAVMDTPRFPASCK